MTRKKRKKRSAHDGVGSSKPAIQGNPLTKVAPVVSDGDMSEQFELTCEVAKVDAELGMVFGWAIICKENGKPYVDLQNDYIPEDVMLKATVEFAQGARIAKEMHTGDTRGSVVHLFPLTTDIAKSLGIESPRTGLLIGMHPDDAMMEKFKSNELRGFSIGGFASSKEVSDD